MSARSISFFLTKTGGPPFRGSVGYVNDAIEAVFARWGWDVRSFRPPENGRTQEALLPFGLAARHALHDGSGRPDVAFHDCAGTNMKTPSRHWADRHVVLYHGLVYGTGAWMANPDIDLHCANSPYTARVLRALFASPDWRRRRCLNIKGLGAVTDIRLPVPCTVDPEGHPGFAYGEDIPVGIRKILDGGLILGHALQPGKQDWIATLSIMFWLDELLRSRGGPKAMLLVSESSLTTDNRRLIDTALSQSGRSFADFFVPVPHLHQRALFQLMRACRFGLAYNRFPEPFGFYVLESVHNGCPVYTNGAGNNRFLLPPGHGITVLETYDMAGGAEGQASPLAYRPVAERIIDDLGHAAAVQEDCARGRNAIDETWSRQAFERSLADAMEKLARPPIEPAFDELRIVQSPLVRGIDMRSGASLNDYASGVLDRDCLDLLRQLPGMRCGDLDGAEMDRLEAAHALFAKGLLTLAPASGEA